MYLTGVPPLEHIMNTIDVQVKTVSKA
jgi:hypothetical protein